LIQKDNFRKYFSTSPKFLPDEVKPALSPIEPINQSIPPLLFMPDEVKPALIFRQPKFRLACNIVLPGGIPLHGYFGQLVARSTSSEKA
jgi:hypothetical protein